MAAAHPSTVQIIRQRLQKSLEPTFLEVLDQSADHIGHPGAAGGGGHYLVIIHAPRLAGKSRLAQHRLINTLLADLFHSDIHALAIEIRDKAPQDQP